MTTATPASTTKALAQAFAARYNVSAIDFCFSVSVGFENFSVFANTPQAGALTTQVPSFDYNSDTDVEAIEELLDAVLENNKFNTPYITEIGGTVSITTDGAIDFSGQITEATPASFAC